MRLAVKTPARARCFFFAPARSAFLYRAACHRPLRTTMHILRLDKVSLAYGHRPLLDHAKLEIRRGERVCLVGRNGEGKPSLIRLLSGEAAPDDGSVWIRPGTRIAHLAQEVSPDSDESVFDIVAGGLAGLGKLISQYHHTATELAHAHTPEGM